VITGMHHEQDMRRMGGLRKYMPITWLTMCAGWLAICGVPIFAGFFSKDEILWKTWSAQGLPPGFAKALWMVGAITALLTAVYMTRLMVMTFWGSERFRDKAPENVHAAEHHVDHAAHEPHESPASMTVPLIVLAVLSTIGGLVGVPYALSSMVGGHPENYFERTISHTPSGPTDAHGADEVRWLSPKPQAVDGPPAFSTGNDHAQGAAGHSPEEISQERLLALVSVLLALSGIGIGWVMFQRQPLRRLPRLLENKYYVDEIYDAAVINPIHTVSREGLWKIFDIGVIDGLVNGLGRLVTDAGKLARYMQSGYVRSYAAIILLGALILIGYFAYTGVQGLYLWDR
jgi:NADH-quinone oxidoreductase subunit L